LQQHQPSRADCGHFPGCNQKVGRLLSGGVVRFSFAGSRQFYLSSKPSSLLQIETKVSPSGGKERPSRGSPWRGVKMVMQTIFEQKVRQTSGILVWLSRIMEFTGVLGLILFFALPFNSVQAFGATVPAGQSVALTWNPSTNSNVAGYNIYYGVASNTYTSMTHVGNITNTTISGMVAGVTYYFAATTYDSLGDQSGYSNVASYAVPTALSTVQIRSASAGQFMLTVTGPIGSTYEILATQDFTVWTVIGTVKLGAGGSLNFTDTNAAGFSHRFYRTLETSYAVPTALSTMQIRSAPAGQFMLTVIGPIGSTNEIQATQDFKTWTVIGTVTLGAGGSLNFTDTNAAGFSHRFYRTLETP
jgi:hypothetical protein